MSKTLNGSLNLGKLIHARMKTAKGAECLLIPIAENLLEQDENGNVYMAIRVNYVPGGDQYGQNGFIAKSTPSKLYKEMDEAAKTAAKEKSPILGSIKDFTGGAQMPTGSVTSAPIPEGKTDDLPF